MEFTIKVIDPEATGAAATLFGEEIHRVWRVSAAKASGWVRSEFADPRTTVFGAFDDENRHLIGCCAISPFALIWEGFQDGETGRFLSGCPPGTEIPNPAMAHVGGLAVQHELPTDVRGLVLRQLRKSVMAAAAEKGYRTLVAQTGVPTGNRETPLLRAAERMKFRILDDCAQKEIIPGLEHIWLMMNI